MSEKVLSIKYISKPLRLIKEINKLNETKENLRENKILSL